jgi:hypothetical protein
VGLYPLTIADATAPISGSIAVETFPVGTRFSNPHPVVVVDRRRKVAHRQDPVIGIFILAEERHNAVVGIVAVHPFKPLVRKVCRVKGRFTAVEAVKGGDKLLELLERVMVE